MAMRTSNLNSCFMSSFTHNCKVTKSLPIFLSYILTTTEISLIIVLFKDTKLPIKSTKFAKTSTFI